MTTANTQSPSRKALTPLIDSGTVAERLLERQLLPLSISVPQYRTLELVALNPGITPSAIAGQLFQETHSVSGLLNRLEDRDLIERRRDHHDRRVVGVFITAAGAKLIESGREVIEGLDRELDNLVDRRTFSATYEALVQLGTDRLGYRRGDVPVFARSK